MKNIERILDKITISLLFVITIGTVGLFIILEVNIQKQQSTNYPVWVLGVDMESGIYENVYIVRYFMNKQYNEIYCKTKEDVEKAVSYLTDNKYELHISQ